MNKKIKKIIAGCIVVVVAGTGGYFGYKKYIASKSTATSSRFITTKVKKGNLDISIQATGAISSVNQVNISSVSAGTITNLPFKEGDPVKKGQLICTIDDSNAQQNVATAQNNLAQKELALSNLEKSLDNLYIKAPIDGTIKSVFVSSGDDVSTAKEAYGSLAIIVVNDTLEVPVPFPSSGKIDKVYISPGTKVKKGDNLFKLDGESIQENIDSAELQIKQAQNDLSAKQENLNKNSITSPIDGIITNLSFKQGDGIDANKQIATIVDPTQMQVVLPVDELDIDKVQVGQKATISVDAIKDKTYEGTVQKINQTGTNTNNVTTFSVTVSINNPERIKSGMNANVTIAVQSKEDVLIIPTEALVNRNGKQFVMVPSTGTTGNSNSSGTNQWNGNGQTGNNQGQGNNQSSNSSGNSGNNGQNSNGPGTNGNSSRRSSTNGSTSSNNTGGRLVPVTIGIQNQTQVEIVDGLKEGDSVLIALPQTSSSSNSRSGMGGFGGSSGFGGSGGFGGGGAGGNRSSSAGRN